MMTRFAITTSSVLLALAVAGVADAAGGQVYSSSSQPSCRVPNVVGRSEREARALIQQADLSVGRVQPQPSQTPAGRVVAQRPQPCGDANSDGVVDLIVSTGPTHDGETPPRRRDGGPSIGTVATVAAAAAIGAAIFASRNKKKPEETTPPPVPPATPAAPPAATPPAPAAPPVAPPRAVTRTAVVPPVVGLSLTEARGAVSGAQLRTVMINAEEAQQPGASVVTQVPAAGTMVVPGASVALTFALPAAPAPAPPVSNATPVEPTQQPVRPAQPVTRPVRPPVARPVAPAADVPVATPATPILPSAPLVNLVATPLAIQPLVSTDPADYTEPLIPWRWIVLALALIAAIGAWPHRTTPLPKRFTFVPHVDPGLQVITESDRSSLAITVALDAGVQEIKYHASQEAIGA